MRRQTQMTMWIAAILISIPLQLDAQGITGRLVLTIQDPDENPMQGVAVSVTCDELPQFKQKELTSKKGKVTLAFPDGTKVYDLRIEHEGYLTIEIPFKPEIRKARSETVTLVPSSAAVSSGGGVVVEDERVYTAAESVFNDGVEALKEGDFQTAKEKFLKAQKMDPQMAAVHSGLGTVYLELGDAASALDSANALLAVQPDNPRGYRLLYEAHQELGDEQAAEKALKRLAELDTGGKTATLLYNEAVEALKVGDRTAAKDRFREVLDVSPDFVPALSALAVILVNDREFEEAAATAERLLTLEPKNEKAMRIAYQSYSSLGDTERESAAFDRLVATNPTAAATHFFDEGVDQFNLGQTAEAIASFERAVAANEALAKGYYYLGLCYANTGENDKAREHFDSFLRLTPDDPDAAVAQEMLKALGD